jgi:hypothetical protein
MKVNENAEVLKVNRLYRTWSAYESNGERIDGKKNSEEYIKVM